MNRYHPAKFWDDNWTLSAGKRPPSKFTAEFCGRIQSLLDKHMCESVLEVGCGEAYAGKYLKGYTGLDFSEVVIDKSESPILHFDITKTVDLPDKSFDCVYSKMVLLHIKPDGIDLSLIHI